MYFFVKLKHIGHCHPLVLVTETLCFGSWLLSRHRVKTSNLPTAERIVWTGIGNGSIKCRN
jgi:hypothetical protein